MNILLLSLRSIIFLFAQSAIALGLHLSGSERPFADAGAYWPLYPLVANAAVLPILHHGAKKRGLRFSDYLGVFSRLNGKEILEAAGMFLLVGAAATLPNVLGVTLLWGDPSIVNRLLFPGLPLSLGIAALFMPPTQALCELPFYYGLCHDRLNGPRKIAAVAAFLTVQHAFLPFVPDLRYLLWRIISFAPIALVYGLLYVKRTRLRPYVLISHALLDLPVAIMAMV